MKKNLTEIVIIQDESGSMYQIKSDVEGGLKTFLDAQRKEKGECKITFYSFSDKATIKHNHVDIGQIGDITINPSGNTALFDAIGQAINDIGARLSKTKEKDRPESVLIIISTDGCENASKEFTNKQVADMIKHQEDKYSWKFIYLGANQDAFATGQQYGFKGATSMTYGTDGDSILNTYKCLSMNVASFRAGAGDSSLDFSQEQRNKAVNK